MNNQDIMDYEKAYKEALERARAYEGLRIEMSVVFPELAESEDERARKEIRDLLVNCCEADRKFPHLLAWLEKQKEQKPAEWSEEDNNYLLTCFEILCGANPAPYTESVKRAAINWLKSLRPRQKYEWDKTDEEELIQIIENGVTEAICREGFKFHFEEEYAKNLIEYITAFNPQPHWKPSEEQITALGCVRYVDRNCAVELESLYNDLKKLM